MSISSSESAKQSCVAWESGSDLPSELVLHDFLQVT
jgi:hypothetical protein